MNKLAKSAILIALLLVTSKVLGFARELCLAYRFGTSYISDAYAICVTLPSVLFTIFASGFSQSYIPMYARVKGGEQGRRDFLNNVLTVLLLMSAVLALVCFLGSDALTAILAPGFDERTACLTSRLIRIVVFNLPFFTAFNILAAHVQAKEDFIFANFCDFIIVNIVVIASILLATEQTPEILAIGYVLSMAAALCALWIYAGKKGEVKYRPRFDLKDPTFAQLCSLALPLGLSLLVSQLNGVVDRLFASSLGEGVTSSLSYADKVQSIFLVLTTSIFLTVCYPRMNTSFAEGDNDTGMYYIKRSFLVALYTSMPMMGGLLLFSRPVVQLLFERGMFSASSTAVTAGCLSFYALGIPFYAFREIATRALAANTRQKLILKNTVLSVLFNVGLNLALVRMLGYIGLALATSLSGLLSFLLMYRDMHIMGLDIIERGHIKDLLKILLSTIVSLGACGGVYFGLKSGIGSDGAIALAVAAAAAVYLLLSVALRIDIFIWVYERLPERVRIISFLNKRIGA